MAKILRCGEVNPEGGCTYVARGETEEQLLKDVAVHARDAHGIQEVTPELLAKVKAHIRNE